VVTLKTEARKGNKEIIDQATRIIDLENDIISKDDHICTLKMQKEAVLGNDGRCTKTEANDDISSK